MQLLVCALLLGAAPYKTTVGIVVDQLGAEVLKKRLPFAAPNGGFARLQKEGVYIESLELLHAITETAPGHAALYTGATPRESGILFNERPAADGAMLSFMLDADTHLVDASGVTTLPGASSKQLRVPSVADQLQKARPQARIVSISLKDRATLMPLGHAKGEGVWYKPSPARFVSSSQLTQTLWPWVADGQRVIEDTRHTIWTATTLPANAPATADDQVGEGLLRGFGRVFPHSFVEASESFGPAFRTSPFADNALLSMARAVLNEAHPPELLLLSFSANDAAGHLFGPDSREAWDVFLHLDHALAELFTLLDQRFGADGWAALLSADHGIQPLPEMLKGQALRVAESKLEETLNVMMQIDFNTKEKYVVVSEPYVWLTAASKKLDAKKRRRADDLIAKTLLGQTGIDRVIQVDKLPATCPLDKDTSVPALVCRSVEPGVGGEYYVVLKRGSVWTDVETGGTGANHGSPWPEERFVPMFVRAPGHATARKVEHASFRSFARTLADTLGVPPPAAAAKAESFAP